MSNEMNHQTAPRPAESCALCPASVPSVDAAVMAGWEPYFWHGEYKVEIAVCPACIELHLEEDPQGRAGGLHLRAGHELALAWDSSARSAEPAAGERPAPACQSPVAIGLSPVTPRPTWPTPRAAGLASKACFAYCDSILRAVLAIIRAGQLPAELAELEIDDDEMSGAWCWWSKNAGRPFPVEIYVTPWWEGDADLVAQVMVSGKEGESVYIGLGSLPCTMDAQDDARAYLDKLVALMRVVAVLAPAVAR